VLLWAKLFKLPQDESRYVADVIFVLVTSHGLDLEMQDFRDLYQPL
jgi:hypothetical protein